jgi:hypothetical protein
LLPEEKKLGSCIPLRTASALFRIAEIHVGNIEVEVDTFALGKSDHWT